MLDNIDDRGQKLTVVKALAHLNNKVALFQNEVEVCDSERLGRVERDTDLIKRGLVFVANQNKGEYLGLQNSTIFTLHTEQCLTLPDMKTMMENMLNSLDGNFASAVANALYRLFTSNSSFNPKTGKSKFTQLILLRCNNH